MSFRVIRAEEHPRLECRDGSRTRQEFLADSQIGSILRTFQATGVLHQPGLSRPQVQDGLCMPDSFQELANSVTEQRETPVEDSVPDKEETEEKENETESAS